MKSSTLAFLLLFIVVILLVGPLVTIWSLNTLFGLDIDYTFWTWLAMGWLSLVTFGGVKGAIRDTQK
jgi:hypothetical protein